MNITGLLKIPTTYHSGEPLHNGTYYVQAISAELFISINDHPYLRVEYTDGNGYAVDYLYFTPAAMKGTLRKLVILGWNPESTAWDISKLLDDPTNVLYAGVTIKVEDVPYGDTVNPRVVSLTGHREKTSKVLRFLKELKQDPTLVTTISQALTEKVSGLIN